MRIREFEKWAHVILFCVSTALSVGCIVYCAYAGQNHSGDWPANAERGGALAAALSFGALFITRPYGIKIYRFLTEAKSIINRRSGAPDNVQEERDLLRALVIRTEVDLVGQSRQNVFMAASAIIGTLAWGFGDWGVYAIWWLIDAHPK